MRHWKGGRVVVGGGAQKNHLGRLGHAECFAEDAALLDLVTNVPRLIFAVGKRVCMPGAVSWPLWRFGKFNPTLPSAQSIICSIGSGALYIDVVAHHTGKPSSITIAQKERRTKYRSRVLSGFSGGGSFLVDATMADFAGANRSSDPLTPGSFASGARFAADMAILSFVVRSKL
jgi:hypothetical protein